MGSLYLPHQSDSDQSRYAFAYTVVVKNEGDSTARLVSRHWIITDGRGHIEDVKGPGVIGEQPRLEPGQEFHYTSGCVLETPRGTMHGTYQMVRDDGTRFDAVINPFLLTQPGAEQEQLLN